MLQNLGIMRTFRTRRVVGILIMMLFPTLMLMAQGTAPTDMKSFRGKNGTSYVFYVTGTKEGRFWGGQNNVYTDDSPLNVAAVHAGLVKAGETKAIKVAVMAGQSSYPSITRNGVTSIQYGSYAGSYKLSAPGSNECPAAPDHMKSFRGLNGKSFTFRVTGKTDGRIWGGQNNVYTDDSNIATAVVHAGILRAGQSGNVTIKVVAGQTSYPSLSRNGVKSTSYGKYDGSYQLMASNSSSSTSSTGSSSTTSSSTTSSSTTSYATAQEAPYNMTGYRGKNGTSYLFYVKGESSGRFWGGQNNIYTDDSPLNVAAVHAGLVRPGERKVIKVTVMAGQSSYPSITRNGVTSIKYGSYAGSYKLSASDQNEVLVAPEHMKSFRGQNGKSFTFRVTGKTDGRIWGGQNNVYTDDSNIATAVVHAGILRAGQSGNVVIKVMSGQASYPSLSRNGVKSISYGKYDGSYQIIGIDE